MPTGIDILQGLKNVPAIYRKKIKLIYCYFLSKYVTFYISDIFPGDKKQMLSQSRSVESNKDLLQYSFVMLRLACSASTKDH